MPMDFTRTPQAVPDIQKQSGLMFVGLIIVLAALVFSFFLAWKWVKKCINSILLGPSTGPAHPSQNISDGAKLAEVEVFPIVCFSSLDEDRIDRECPVCLSSFKDNEMLRLLPGCKHGFHLHCIELWLRTHSTCPLCRRNAMVMEKEPIRTHTQLRGDRSELTRSKQSLVMPELKNVEVDETLVALDHVTHKAYNRMSSVCKPMVINEERGSAP